MQENYELVQRGFRVLVSSLSGYIGRELRKTYQAKWWDEVLIALSGQWDLPSEGSDSELVDSLDIANCLRLIDRKWSEVFRNSLPMDCRTWAKELMGVRNIVSHIGQQDLDQRMAERALDTMVLLCKEIDPNGEERLRTLYREVRARAGDAGTSTHTPLAQPASESKRGALGKGSLLQQVGTDVVQETTLTRKVAFGGKTEVYPVYRIRLDALFYNDQNDRIATWISRYESENGKDTLGELSREVYNAIIENFICESNPEAIQKTQKNIDVFGQREPGVTLADGRIVDGNRRYTCLRKIQKEKQETVYFETVILDVDIHEDKKQIKLLELAIQHGEEKKVDYDLIDYAVGTYRDVVQTQLLTEKEYALSSNETVAEVRKRIEIAQIINEFLAYLRLPEQYHVAREYQVYSLFQEMMAPLKQLDDKGKEQLKTIAFNNAMLKAIPDQRKFIRDIKSLIKNSTYTSYFEEQQGICEKILREFGAIEVHSKSDLDRFAMENVAIAEQLQMSMERALRRSRSQQLKAKPAENVSKCIALMLDMDPRLFEKLDPDERETLKAELDELSRIVNGFQKHL